MVNDEDKIRQDDQVDFPIHDITHFMSAMDLLQVDPTFRVCRTKQMVQVNMTQFLHQQKDIHAHTY